MREHGRKSISIHAPARGATFCHLLALLNTRNFNPRSREGSDGPSDVTLLTVPVFQSTLPRGERHLPQTRCPENVYFNPRSREGSDMPKPFKTVLMFHFNPRSREGSDCRSLFRFSRSCDFNPRSREGSDAILSRDPRNAEISIHAPARGATMQAQKRAILQRISIHAPARGATRLRLFWSFLS